MAARCLTIRLLGGAGVCADGVPVALNNRKACALLAFLASSDALVEQRERLCGMFWSESSEENARTSLRQVVLEIKKALEPHGADEIFLRTKTALGLCKDKASTDLCAIVAALRAGEVPEELLTRDRLAETFLAGLEELDSAFRGWVLTQRHVQHDRLMRLVQDGYRNETAATLLRRRFAEAARRLDPTDEEACRVFMRMAAEEGNPAVALRAFDDLSARLADEYDAEPTEPTVQLWVEIKQGKFDPHLRPATHGPARPAPAAAARADMHADKLVIEIASFGVNGVSDGRTHLVTGFRHELIAHLTKFREWRILDGGGLPARPTGAAPPLARYEVEATAYQAGATIQMVLTLRDRMHGIFVWSESFELDLEGWFQWQRRIVRRIAVTMNGQISAQRLHRAASEPDIPLEIYDHWLRAQEMTSSFGYADWQKAEKLLAETIAAAPTFSPVYSSLVQMRNTVHIVFPGVRRNRARFEETIAIARRAVELDPHDSRANLCLGWSLAMAGKHLQAETYMSLACELNANDSWSLVSAALFFAFCGKFDRGQTLLRQSLDAAIVPTRSHWAYAVSIAYLSGDDEETLCACERADDVILTLPAWRAAALYNLGREAEARREAARFIKTLDGHWFGEAPVSAETAGGWLLHLYPISEERHWERLRRGIGGAGIPAAATHGAW